MNRTVRLPFINRRIRVLYFAILVAIIVGSVGAFAASVTITTSNNAAYQGVYVNANGYYSVTGTAYNVVEAAQAATTQPLAWASGGGCHVNPSGPRKWGLTYTPTNNPGGVTRDADTITFYNTAAT